MRTQAPHEAPQAWWSCSPLTALAALGPQQPHSACTPTTQGRTGPPWTSPSPQASVMSHIHPLWEFWDAQGGAAHAGCLDLRTDPPSTGSHPVTLLFPSHPFPHCTCQLPLLPVVIGPLPPVFPPFLNNPSILEVQPSGFSPAPDSSMAHSTPGVKSVSLAVLRLPVPRPDPKSYFSPTWVCLGGPYPRAGVSGCSGSSPSTQPFRGPGESP